MSQSPKDPEPEGSSDPAVLEGLWDALLLLVPMKKRTAAWALANTLHHLLRLPEDVAITAAYERGHRAGRIDGFASGVTCGETSGRLAQQQHQGYCDSADEDKSGPTH